MSRRGGRGISRQRRVFLIVWFFFCFVFLRSGVVNRRKELGQKFEAENQTFYPHSAWTEGSETTPYCLKSQVTRRGSSTVCIGIS